MSGTLRSLPSLAGITRTFAGPLERARRVAGAQPAVVCGEQRLTHAELYERVQRLVGALRAMGLGEGARVAVVGPNCHRYLELYLAVPAGGFVLVPLNARHTERELGYALEDSEASVLFATAAYRALEPAVDRFVELPDGYDAVLADSDSGWWGSIREDDLAGLFYTGGTTGAAKGVMLTHGNLIHNERMIQAAFRHGPETVVAGWLPQFHDMGLIGNVLQPIFMGVPCILMPPMAFMQRPARWLRMVSNYRVTTSGGPNFAYELCVRKVRDDQLEGVDLSSWTLAFSGAEPVRARTLDLFARRFAPHGFRRQAFYPCYGLAEATLFVAGPKPGQPTRLLRVLRRSLEERQVVEASAGHSGEAVETLVGCGRSAISQSISIVDPGRLVLCAHGEVGEIWVSGPSVAAGYWKMPELSANTFEGHLADDPGHSYLRTGDLGVIVDEQLFVCGRLKDLIIIRGRNHAPEDIEWSASLVLNDWGAGSSVAFSVQGDEAERLVLVQEIDRKTLRSAGGHALAARLRRVIAHEHGLQLSDVVFVKLASIPRTSSGKVQRHRCRALYEAGTLSRLDLDVTGMARVGVSASLPTRVESIFLEES